MNIGDFFRQTVRRSPDRAAVICGDRSWTFREVDERSDALASWLQDAQVAPGTRVLICLENGIEFVEAFAAVAKIGAIVVPVSPRLMPDEIAPILLSAQPAVAIVKDCRTVDYTQSVAHCLVLDRDGGGMVYDEVIAANRGRRPAAVEATDLFAICYTSGTSGASKGAMLTHDNLIFSHGLIGSQLWGMSSADVFLVSMSLAARASMGRLIFLFCFGGTLVLLEKFDPRAVVDAIGTHRVTVANMVPTVAKMALEELERGSESCKTLRRLLVMGGAFPADIRDRLCRLLPSLEVHSILASTEAGVITSLPPAMQSAKAGSVGLAVPGIEIRIGDDAGAELPQGEIGEILLRSGSPGEMLVLKGYFGNAEQTSAAFVDGWFRTGDLGYFDADGFLFLVDRKKDMIKTGGYNVYANEVESCLKAHPAVEEVAVVGIPDDIYDEAIAAFVQLKAGGAGASKEELIDHCRSRIAGYKKPRTIVFVAAMPRNEMGKILKRQLKSEYLAGSVVRMA